MLQRSSRKRFNEKKKSKGEREDGVEGKNAGEGAG
jgi:hypothetical protein